MKKPITEQQYRADFKEVLLFFTCWTIHKFFNDDPKRLFKALSDYREIRSDFLATGTKVSAKKNHDVLRDVIWINYGLGIPATFIEKMFHTRTGKQNYKAVLDNMVSNKELRKIQHGVLPSKERMHFTIKYLLPMETLEEFFADKDLAKTKLENRQLYWTKRQNRFIGKEIDRRMLLKKEKEACAVKKQTEQDDAEMQAQVNEFLASNDD